MLNGKGKRLFTGGPGGAAGPANVLTIRSVTTGPADSAASATISGTAPNQVVDLVIPQGAVGAAGPVAWAPIVPWATGLLCVASAPATTVSYNGAAYACAASHLAGTFATDLAAGRWLQVSPAGAPGTNGTNGNTVQNGSGAPANALGANGDFYLDTTNTRLYGPKAGGAWPTGYTSLVGAGALLAANNLSELAGASAALAARVNLGAAEAGNSDDPNVLDNSAFDLWQRGTASTSCPVNTRTFLADRVWVNPAGAAVTQAQAASVPTGSKGLYSLQVTGAASVTTVNVGLQRIEAREVPRIKRTSTFQAAIFNNTGAAFTPLLIFSTPSAADNYSTVTAQYGPNFLPLQSCAPGAWTVVSYTGDLSGLPNIANGLQIELQIPTGVLVAGKSVNVAHMDLRPGSAVQPFERRPTVREQERCFRFYETGSIGIYGNCTGGSGYFGTMVCFRVTKRVTPSVNYAEAIAQNTASSSASQISTNGFLLQSVGTSGYNNCLTAGTYVANSEL